MAYRLIDKIKWLTFMSVFYVSACSKDLENLPLNEKALYQTDRFSADKPKDSYRKPLDILNFSGVKPGMQVIDLLGGDGYYTELFSYIVGEKGKVYLQNNSLFLRFSKKEMEKRLKDNRLKNVVRTDSEYAEMNLPSNVDMIFMGLSFHDFFVNRSDGIKPAVPEQLYHQLRSALKPGGVIVLTDHAASVNSGLKYTRLHRIGEEWVKTNLEANGFEFVDSIDVLRNPNDDKSLDIWNKKVKSKTDRFVHKYRLKVQQPST